MLEKPRLQDKDIITCLRAGYGLPVAGVEFLPIGNDATAWVYCVWCTDCQRYFLKVKRAAVEEASLLVPRYLKDSGIEQIVAPLPAINGRLRLPLDGFALILYPFIEGSNGMARGLSDDQWIEYGAILKTIHSVQLPPDLARQMNREDFKPYWGPMVRRLQAEIETKHYADPHEQALATFWRARRDDIARLVERAEELGRRLRQRSLPPVLCHADAHTANLLIDGEGRLFVVDWDQTLLAPKERDLMFVAPGVISARQQALFFQGYGAVEIDQEALAYYRYEWVVQDIGDYGERVFLTDAVGEETKADAVRSLMAMFQPDDVVEVAYATDAQLNAAG